MCVCSLSLCACVFVGHTHRVSGCCCSPSVVVLRNVVGVCDILQRRHSSNDFPDVFALLEEAGAVAKLEALQTHEHTEVYTKSVRVLVC